MRRKTCSGSASGENAVGAPAVIDGGHARDIRPADTSMICHLVKPQMKDEIEIAARRRTGGP
jgi:hypothetical protein